MHNEYPTEQIDVRIKNLTHDGLGFARHIHPPKREGECGKHLRLFVRDVVPGDVVRLTVENAKGRNKAVVDYDELLEAGPSRNLNRTADQPTSAGAPLQYMNYADQLAYKEASVCHYLEEAGLDVGAVRPIIGMDQSDRYRNKMELTFGEDGALGMHKQANFRQVVDVDDSVLMTEEMLAVKEVVSQWQQDHGLAGYNKINHCGLLRNLMLRQSFATGELMIVIYALEGADQQPAAAHDLTDRLSQQFSQLTSLQWVKHSQKTERIQADSSRLLYGRDFIYDELSGFTYRIWPDTFFQANAVQAEVLVDQALAMAQVNEDMRVLDLFCGVGTFSLPLAARARELAGIEIVETSIESAKRNAHDNGLGNTFFMASDARTGLKELPDRWGMPDLLVLDPPRSGAGGKVMRAIGRMGTEKVIYVSCSPKSLAKDLVWLEDYGYQLKAVQPVDQFPHTPHVESVVLMTRSH